MNTAIKNRTITWLVVILLLANIATIAVFWLDRSKKQDHSPQKPKDFLTTELNLDETQKKKYEELVKDHQQSVRQVREKVKEMKDSYFDLLKSLDATDSLRSDRLKQISLVTERLDSITFDHFQKLRNICTPGQQKKFDEIIHRVLTMMAGPPGGRKGPPPGADRPPPPTE